MTRRKILVVDDEPFHCNILREFLVETGYSVVEAHDGDRALELYRDESPDVVLLDVVMPGKDGLEVLREIKAIDPEAAVVMLTTVSEEHMGKQARAEGALEYITKPVNLDYLEVALQTVIGSLGLDK